MKARFTRTFAWIQVALGFVVIIASVVGAVAIMFGWGIDSPSDRQLPPRHLFVYRLGAASPLLAVAAGVGIPFVVFGQLVLVFLEMRSRMARIDRRLQRWDDRQEGQGGSALLDRVLQK